jgi:hypothetical protein
MELSPNSLALWGALKCTPGTDAPDTEEVITPPDKLCIFYGKSPFLQVTMVCIPIKCTFDHLGILSKTDPMSHRNIIMGVHHYLSASQLEWKHLLQFHTAIHADRTPIFTVSEAFQALDTVDIAIQALVSLIVAHYRPDPTDRPTCPVASGRSRPAPYHLPHYSRLGLV